MAAYGITAVRIGAVVADLAVTQDLDSAVEQTKAETQAVRTGLAAAGGAGAAFTLLLAVRRQCTTEHDTTERWVTEPYTTAAEQLGHEHAAVRLGGLYTLQLLAQCYSRQPLLSAAPKHSDHQSALHRRHRVLPGKVVNHAQHTALADYVSPLKIHAADLCRALVLRSMVEPSPSRLLLCRLSIVVDPDASPAGVR